MAENDEARASGPESGREKERSSDGEDRLAGGGGAPAPRRDHTPDVILKVPTLAVDEIELNVSELSARVALHASVGELVALDVGADVSVERVELLIKGVNAQAELEVHLDRVYDILARTLTTIDRNPDLLAHAIEPIGEAVHSVARTAEEVVPELGRDLGETATKTVGDLGETVQAAVERPVDGEVAKTSPGAVVGQRVPAVHPRREVVPAPAPAADPEVAAGEGAAEKVVEKARAERETRAGSNGEPSLGRRMQQAAAKSARRVARSIRRAAPKRRKEEARERP